ncbi:DUF2254 domain-containing protein [Lutimaribacter sp. EGI FJ00015]|uniref:DUF2254 domain-containing protein n=1 Tax=Lutimaribacter degradans TaxID=2945989 RepID=A0ACC5ZTA3_9RHOB|nr:DUF2254 domain-containing protein [Lutimaribacter sp. EGI FJ00013]MCM2561536.1 DUF2254 domain-containing protein [Lutimaribacter sp. EGI FJ00013]MCO0612753.1 DUF2254 domain-containing protein [Lutimaribacter sp. EGI FJ00015]MCO0635411.1 DUF2254 domain-containing protein [Lutimaribacter sp. EGI FJ00014]
MTNYLKMPLSILKRFARKLWVRVTLFAVLAVAVAVAASLVTPLLPEGLANSIGPDAVMPVLSILASSMLAVSTFSLSIMVASHQAAAGNATPRIHRILLEDTTTQSVLATFIGAFVYSLTSIILFRADIYPEHAAIVIMAVTVTVTVLVIVAMLRWIHHLSSLGSMDDSLQIAYELAHESLGALARQPAQGANPLTRDTILPTDLTPVPAPSSGYVQMIDMAGLQDCTGPGILIYVARRQGRHVLASQALAHVSGNTTQQLRDRIARCFVTADLRNHEQDAEFSLLVLSEIASKALSPGINDAGTAIEVITRLETLLWEHARDRADQPTAKYHNVFCPVPSAGRLVNAGFAATARDGAGLVEVALQLRQALLELAQGPQQEIGDAATELAQRALAYADAALPLQEEKDMLRAVTV